MNYLSLEEFKEKVLTVKGMEQENKLIIDSVKMEAVNFCSILPELFGSDLDRLTLWNRIGSAIETSIIKANYDIEFFVNLCLEHIKAEHSRVAAHEGIKYFVESNIEKSDEWKKLFFNYLSTRYFLIIAKARTVWEEKKENKKEN